MKFAFVSIIVYAVSSQPAAAHNSAAAEEAALALHSQLRYVESEIMRVWVTIDAIVDQISQSSDAISDETHKNLANLYFYDCELNAYLQELETELSRRNNPSTTVFQEKQFEPIHTNRMNYRVPPGAFPILDTPRIETDKSGY